MENATKALLIAAAVLVAIIIISLGVTIVSGDELDDAEIEAFNSKFSSYEGTSVSGTRVKALVKTAYQQNQKEDDESRRVNVKLTDAQNSQENLLESTNANPTDTSGKIKTGSRYSVSFDTKKSGMIETINLTEIK